MILELDKVALTADRLRGEEIVDYSDAFGDERTIRCHVDLGVRKIGETYYLDLTLSGNFTCPCHKCLEPARVQIDTTCELVVQRIDPRAVETGADTEDDYLRLPMGEHELDLTPYIHENFVVNIPFRILCSDDCKGLCSHCGQNLNTGTCNCESPSDTRWDALKKLGEARTE